MNHNHRSFVLFVCEHGSAKSVVAAAHFNRLARERGLDVQAVSRGTNPDDEMPSYIIAGLEAEGLTVGELKPKLLSEDDMVGASLVVAFCDLPDGFDTLTTIAQWNDIPPISEDYDISRNAMLLRLDQLLYEMTSKAH